MDSTHCKETLGDGMITILAEIRPTLLNVLHLTQYGKHSFITWKFNFKHFRLQSIMANGRCGKKQNSHKWRSCIFIFHSYYPRKMNLSCNRGMKIYDLDKSKDMNGSSWGEITRHKMLNLKGILRNNVFLWATKWKTKNNVQFCG